METQTKMLSKIDFIRFYQAKLNIDMYDFFFLNKLKSNLRLRTEGTDTFTL